MLSSKQRTGARSIYSRMMRLVVPMIMGTFLIIGLVLLFGIRASGRDALTQTHQTEVDELSRTIDSELQKLIEDTRQVATSRVARDFARDTLINISNATVDQSQARLLGDFTSLLEQHRNYLAVRYITFNGSVWSEATNYDGSIPVTDAGIQLGVFANDPLLLRALAVDPGDVVMSDIAFQTESAQDTPIPYLRLSSSVTPDSSFVTNVAGVVQLDAQAVPLLQLLRSSANTQASHQNGRRVIVADREGNILYDTAQPNFDYVTALAQQQSPKLSAQLPSVAAFQPGAALVNAQDNGDNIISTGTITVGTPEDTNWTIALIDNASAIETGSNLLSVVALAGSLLLGALISLVIGGILRHTLRPIGAVQSLVDRWASDGTPVAPVSGEAPDDEIAHLTTAFQSMTARIQELKDELETQQGRYSRNMDIAARVGRETATLYDIDELLNRAIRLICEEYGFYHAQVFLIDDVGDNAVLVYSYGEVGRQLLQLKHKIPVGSDSVIGTVTKSGTPVIVNDVSQTGQAVPHRFNPLLPQTRAEMALPLQFGERITGALDIQSAQPDSFQADEVQTFQILADQIAIAIQNVRLLVQSEERVTQIDALNRQLTRMAWEETSERSGLETVYRYDLLKLEDQAPEEAPSLSLPIAIRGEVVGSLDAAPPEGAFFTEGDRVIMRAVADRVAIAIENARLFEETQSSLSETFTLYQLSRYLNEADSLEDILQAIVVSVMPDAISGQIGVFDEYNPNTQPQNLEIAVDWTLSEDSNREVMLSGTELHVPDHPILAEMEPNQVTLVTDAEHDQRLDEIFRAILSSTSAQAMVLIPFSVRSVWRGVIMVQFPVSREFSEREGRIYGALIDQAGVAIDNRMLLQQNEMALAGIERLYSASRIINMAQSMPDLVRAAVNTTDDPSLNFELGVFEGELDSSGWPTRVRIVARSLADEVSSVENEGYDAPIDANSPLRRREPLIVQDRDPGSPDPSSIISYMRTQGYRASIMLPLFSANQPIALFAITSQDQHELTTEDYEVYRALTGQMSTVLQNRRLLEQTERALDETRRLYAASRAIAAAPDSNTVYQAASVHLATASTTVSRVSILLAGPSPSFDAPYVDYVYVWGRGTGGSQRAGERITREVVPFAEITQVNEGTLQIQDVQTGLAEMAGLKTLLENNSSKSALLTTIQLRQRWYGLVICESTETHAFSEGYVNFARAIADQVAIAVESLLSFEEAQMQAQRALALAEAGQLASRMGGDFAESLGGVFSRVAEPANYDRWLLALVDESGKRLETLIEHMPPTLTGIQSRSTYFDLESDKTPVAQAYLAQRTILLNDPAHFPGFEKLPPAQQVALGKAVITPVRLGNTVIGALLVGRSAQSADLDESDVQLAATLAAQVAITVENQRLFRAAESERARLSSILESLPAGVLVLDPITYKPIQFNQQIEALLGRPVDIDAPFDAVTYNIYRSGTNSLYPQENLPIVAVTEARQLVASDDIAIITEDGMEVDLLMNAVPIFDSDGSMSAIVAAFQDISALRNLERTLEGNLRETVALYETTRALSEAEEVEDVLDQVLYQLSTQDASDAFIALLDEQWEGVRVVRSLNGDTGAWMLPSELLNPRGSQFVPDVAEDFDIDEAVRLALQKQNVAAFVSIPMRARSRRDVPLGWMVIIFSEAQDFTPEREQFLSTLNDNAAVALDNRYLFESTEEALQETAALYGATTNLSRARTAEEIGDAIRTALESLAPDIYGAYLSNDDRLIELFNFNLDSAPLEIDGLITRYDLLEAQNMFIDDLREVVDPTPFEAELLAIGTIQAVALVHLRSQSQDRASGCFFLAYHRPNRFSSGDARYLNSIADSASVVADNYLLLDQIRSSLEETSILYQASRAFNDASTSEQILDVIVNHLTNRPVSQIFMALLSTENWDNPKAMAKVVATWQREGETGIDLEGINLVAEQYPAWRLLASPQVLAIDNVSESEELDLMERIGVESLELSSLSILPLRVAGRSIGAVVIGGHEPFRHTDRDLRIYRSLAEQASLRMEATRLLAQTERRARQLGTSAQVSQIASSILDLNILLPRIVDLIRDTFGYDHVQIFLMDEADDYAALRASTGEAGRQLLEIRHKLQKGSASVIGQVTATGEPSVASDTADARVVHRPNPYLPNTRSEMAIPLKLKGNVVGALDVQSNQPNAFADDDIAVLTTLAAQVSVAIDNAQLFEQASSRANEMSFLFSVTTAAASAENLQDAIQNVANELLDSLHALSTSIYLPQTYVDADDKEWIVLEPVALAGSDQPISELSEVRLDSESNLIADAANERHPIIIANILAEPSYLPVVDSARSAIIVPLTSGMRLIGLVALESAEPHAYDDDTLTLLLTLSGTLSAIIQNQQLLQQMQETNEQLRELDRLKSDFLANMSHELRTPLNSIIGFSRVILKGIDGPLTEMQEQDLTTIYNSGLHLLNLINDILDQAKIAAGKMDLQFDYFEMKAVIDGVRSIGIGLVKDKQIDIFVDIAPGLPKVYGDEFRTRQVLINLVSNASKFTREGSINISSYPVRDEESGMMMIRTDVTDTGIGIAEKDMALLFEAFRQVDSSLTRTQGGTGLGLPISKSLVEMQGGRMLVSSRVNVGSTFSILMPVEPVVEEEEKPKKKTTDHLGQPPATTNVSKGVTGQLTPPPQMQDPSEKEPPFVHIKRQILLIEDNPDMVDQYRRALQREGFDIFTASIPLEAEAMASGLHPTIIIMDVGFANNQGWDILGKLKARDDTFDIPVIVVTLSQERDRACDMGAFRFIQRPFTPDDLVKAVEDAEADSRIDRILIIDDQPESVRLLTNLLDEQGQFRVFSAANGAEGIAMVARRRPNLVILDLRMPEMDGFQVVQELRNNPETATIPILVVTGDSINAEEREQLMNLAVLHKGEISADEYRQFIDGVKAYLSGD